MNIKKSHNREVEKLQGQIRNLYEQRKHEMLVQPPVSLQYSSKSSYTIRTKSYKDGCTRLDCRVLDRVIEVDPIRQVAKVEPRVSMEKLVRATLPHGLTAAVVPEFKDITVGGAIMGVGGESGSHRWGCFHDICDSFEIILADGRLMQVSPVENADLFYGICGSYGSLGTLTAANIKLIPANKAVHVRYRVFSTPQAVVEALSVRVRASDAPDFIDGIIFRKNLAVLIEGTLVSKCDLLILSKFSAEKLYSESYWQHALHIALEHPGGEYQELMDHYDYFFRYDPGAFWMSAYLFHLPLLARLIFQGILRWTEPSGFNASEIRRFHSVPDPKTLHRILMRPFASCKNLCGMLHMAEKWVQNRFIIQDFCFPESKAIRFLEGILDDPGIFPLWLLPIKGTHHPQIFAPHLLTQEQPSGYFINFGLYGLPSNAASPEQITRTLEQKTWQLGGRKILYSRSYYTKEEFWEIYSREAYESLRKKTAAEGFWHDIVQKVLSV